MLADRLGAADEARAVAAGRTDGLDPADAAAARCFFSTVLDAVGAQPDAADRDTVPADLSDDLTVGRPIADA